MHVCVHVCVCVCVSVCMCVCTVNYTIEGKGVSGISIGRGIRGKVACMTWDRNTECDGFTC